MNYHRSFENHDIRDPKYPENIEKQPDERASVEEMFQMLERAKQTPNQEIHSLIESAERKILQLRENWVELLPRSLVKILNSVETSHKDIELSNIVGALTN